MELNQSQLREMEIELLLEDLEEKQDELRQERLRLQSELKELHSVGK